MRLLLDTNAVIHIRQNWPGFSSANRDLLSDPANTIYFSSVSAAEIAIKTSKGKLDIPVEDLDQLVNLQGWTELPFTVHHATKMLDLPDVHKDPFDRMIIAQALTEGLPVVTTDRLFSAYGVQVIQ